MSEKQSKSATRTPCWSLSMEAPLQGSTVWIKSHLFLPHRQLKETQRAKSKLRTIRGTRADKLAKAFYTLKSMRIGNSFSRQARFQAMAHSSQPTLIKRDSICLPSTLKFSQDTEIQATAHRFQSTPKDQSFGKCLTFQTVKSTLAHSKPPTNRTKGLTPVP